MQLTKEQITEVLNNYLSEKDLNSLLEVVLDSLMYSERKFLLKQKIISGEQADDIRKSWTKDIEDFKRVRAKYLIYK